MQNSTEMQTSSAAIAASQPVPTIETVSAITSEAASKRAALAAKLQAARLANVANQKPANAPAIAATVAKAKPTAPAKPTADSEAKREAFALARAACAGAVSAFYSGKSLPFKAAFAKLSPLNTGSRVCNVTARQTALLQCLAVYGAKAFSPSGAFTRNAFIVPARVINPQASAGLTVTAQPESGCLSDGRGTFYSFRAADISNPSAVIGLNVERAADAIQSTSGDKQRKAFLTLLSGYGVTSATALLTIGQAGKASPKAKAA